MNKEEIIFKVSAKTGLDIHDTRKVINLFINGIKHGLINGESIDLREFGSFRPVERAERKARDIARGHVITVPAHMSVKFTPSTLLKDAINGR